MQHKFSVAPYVKKALAEDVQAIKNLGVNTIGFYPNYHFVNGTLSMSNTLCEGESGSPKRWGEMDGRRIVHSS